MALTDDDAAGLRDLLRDFGREYDITQTGLMWYGWRFNVRSEPLRASSCGELRDLIGKDRRQPAARLPRSEPAA